MNEKLENIYESVITGDLTTAQTEVRGGAPVTAEFARQIGADGFAADAGQAANVVTTLLDQ